MTANQRVGRPPKQDDLDRKSLVLEAAIEKIAEHGFDHVKLTDIGQKAGVAPALIRHYFGSKDGLIKACNSAVGQRLFSLIAFIEAEIVKTPKGHILHALVNAFRQKLPEEQVLMGYLCWLFHNGGDDANALYKRYFDALSKIVEDLKARDVVSEEVSTYWFVQQYISIQLGPHFLAKPMADHLGKDPFSPEVSVERSVSALQTLRAAAIWPIRLQLLLQESEKN